MKKASTYIRYCLFFIIVIILVAPTIQGRLNLIELSPLNGAIVKTEETPFSFDDWFSGEYQSQQEKYLNESFGFRNLCVRINNQLAFDLFNKAKANSLVIGENNQLYEEMYIRAYYGTDFIGVDKITQRMKKLKFIQDTLAKLGKTLLIVFAPGKGSFYPEFIPERYKTKIGETNYQYYTKLAYELGIHFIDFNKYFIANKTTSKYPLYPKYGCHWSCYGASLAADSIIKYIEKNRQIDMPDLYWKSLKMEAAKGDDYDASEGMNLLFDFKHDTLAYPDVQAHNDSSKVKPSILVVADSYYTRMHHFLTIASSKEHFWFYNTEVTSDFSQNGLKISQLNLREEINNHDVFIIMATDGTLPGLGWGFIENTYNLFSIDIATQKKMELIERTKIAIKSSKEWLHNVERQAKEKGITLDSCIEANAIWMAEQELKKK